MKIVKKVLSFILTIFMVLIMSLNMIAVQAAKKKTVIPIVKFAKAPVLQYTAGDVVNFDLHAPDYTGKVQYRAILWDNNKKEARDLWTTKDRYYQNWMPSGSEIFNLHWKIDEPGLYRITIYVKRAGIKNSNTAINKYNCDSYMESQAFAVKKKTTNFDKDGQTYGSIDEKKVETYNSDINILGENITFNNAALSGSLIITGDNVVIRNVTVVDKIVIDPGKDGSCKLENVTAKNIQVLSGGWNSIHIKNSKAETMDVNGRSNLRVEIDGDTEIVSTSANGYVIFDRKNGTFGTITITKNESGESVIEFRGNIKDKVEVEGTATIKTVQDSQIAHLVINAKNNNDKVKLEGRYEKVEINSEVKLKVEANTRLERLISNKDSEITLDKTAVVSYIEKKANRVIVIREGNEEVPVSRVDDNDDDVYEPSIIPVGAIGITGMNGATKITTDKGILQMTASVTPINATNKNVTWSVVNVTGSATISSTGLLKAINNGTVIVKATANDGSGKFGEIEITISGQQAAAQTLAEARAAAEAAIAGLTVSNATVPEDIMNAVNAVITNPGITAQWGNGSEFTKTLANVGSAGVITGKIELLKSGETTIEVVLNKIIAPLTVNGVVVKQVPLKLVYTEGEILDLTGLVITLTKSDSTTEDVALSDFAAKGITTSPSNGAKLSTSNAEVIITAYGKTISQAITVKKVALLGEMTFRISGFFENNEERYIEGAKITIDGKTIFTDKDGMVSINLCRGTIYPYIVEYAGFQTYRSSVLVGATNFHGIALEPITKSLKSFTPVTFTQTGDVANNNVQYKNAEAVIAALPAVIEVTLEDNTTKVEVQVIWSDTDIYNASKAGDYTFTAMWGLMPTGADNEDGLEAPIVEVTVAQGAAVQTLAEAKSAAETVIANFIVSNTTTADNILNAIKAVIVNNQITVQWKTSAGFNKKDAAEGVEGLITGTIELQKAGEENLEVNITKTIASLPDTTKPIVIAESQTVANTGQSVNVQSNEGTGFVYIIMDGEKQETIADFEAAIAAKKGAKAKIVGIYTVTSINTDELSAGTYYAYAVDGAGNISVKGTNEISIIEVSAALDASSITVNNNSATKDTIKVIGLTEGDIVKVYDSSDSVDVLGTGTVAAGQTEVTITLDADLGDYTGSIFVAVIRAGKAESTRTEKAYDAEIVAELYSKAITGFNYSIINQTQAKACSKPMSTSDFSIENKSFTISDGVDTVPVDFFWNIPQNEYATTPAMSISSGIDAAIQDYFNLTGRSEQRTLSSMSFGGNTFSVSNSLNGSKSKIIFGGNDWSYFFDQKEYYGTDEDRSQIKIFTIGDGYKTVSISLLSDMGNIENLIRYINSLLQSASVAVYAEKVDDNHFKLIAARSGLSIYVGGTDKDVFFN